MLPKELLKEKAYLTYLVTDTYKAVADKLEVAPSTVRTWALEGGWDEKKQSFYDNVHTQMKSVEDDLLEKRGRILHKVYDRLEHLLDIDMEEAEVGSKLDIAQAFSEIANALTKFSPREAHQRGPSPVTINIGDRDEYQRVMMDIEQQLEE